jgi:hypothetical protein
MSPGLFYIIIYYMIHIVLVMSLVLISPHVNINPLGPIGNPSKALAAGFCNFFQSKSISSNQTPPPLANC